MNSGTVKKILYFGIYRPTAPRDRVYLEALKGLGFEVAECTDSSAGFLKFFRLAKKLLALKNQYDILWVGYLSTMVVPLARFLSRRPVVFNALDSWYDRAILDRAMHARFSSAALVIWLFDFLAFRLSHIVLVESQRQKIFIAEKFFVRPEKLSAVFTGVDEAVFHPDSSVAKAPDFTVVFRGMFLPATGVEFVLEAARLLKNQSVKFVIIGWGEPIQAKIVKMVAAYGLANVRLVTRFLPPDELRKTMLSAHVMLGQFGSHPRLERTIQNKNMEALALGLPFITRDSQSNRELLADGENCFFVPAADPEIIAKAIIRMRDDEGLRRKLGAAARATYRDKLRPEILSEQVMAVIYDKAPIEKLISK